MVEIVKGNKTLSVTQGAFENFYESAGWEKSNREADDEWDTAILETGEVPVSKMSHDELVEKAIELGVDISDNPSNKQLRERIRNNA